MNVISRLFGRSGGDSEPWTEDSIYRLIASHVDPQTGAMVPEDLVLPDEPDEAKIRWAAGAADGVMGHHADPGGDAERAKKLAKLLDGIARNDRSSLKLETYAVLKEDSVLSVIDETLGQLEQWQTPVEPYLQQFALQLTTKSADRGPVKAGIALLGAMRAAQHEQVVTTLALHEEFTLFAAIALINMVEQPEAALWSLARKLRGWGRIQLVERLVPTKNEALRLWLRTEGFRNSVMYEYLAMIAAEQGQLRFALEQKDISFEELGAAGEILCALIAADFTGAGMDEYTEAAATCLAYFNHVRSARADLRNFRACHAVLRYLDADERSEADRLKCGWSDSARTAVRTLVTELIARAEWPPLISEGLGSESLETFSLAHRAAADCAMNTFEWDWRRVQAAPGDSARWFQVMASVNGDRIDEVLQFAERVLPLDQIGSGPAEELGLGPAFGAHRCLAYVVQRLRAFPGKGARLIGTGLRSPVISDRRMAVRALEQWDGAHWSLEMVTALRNTQAVEPHAEVAEEMAALLATSRATGSGGRA